MQNLWEVMHRLVDGDPMTKADKDQAHELIEVHLQQHLGIARTQGEHREKLRAHREDIVALKKHTGLPEHDDPPAGSGQDAAYEASAISSAE